MKVSLVKSCVALVIGSCYMFVCGVTGTIGGKEMTAAADSSSQTAEASSESGTAESTDGGAEGQGTLDFLVPDETSTGYVSLQLFEMTPLSLANKSVQSTYTMKSDNASEPDEAGSDGTGEQTAETNEIVINPPEDTDEEEPAATTTAATTTTAVTYTEPTTAATEPVVVTTAPQTTTAATTQQTTTAKAQEGIPVEEESTTAVPDDDEPDVTEPEESGSGYDVSGEVLYVRSNGSVVSGSALEIVGKITQQEVGHTFAPEAIKAQAVAAYTYVKFCNDYGTYPSVSLASTVSDSVEVLVESVIGQGIYYNGTLIQAVYSASSAGYTASSMNVWGTDYPYLVSRFCDLDAQYDPNYGKTAQFASDEIKQNVLSTTGIELSGDPSEWLSIENRIDGNYVGQMSVGGYHSYTDSSGNSVKITGRVFREKIMGYDLRSSSFDIAYDSDTDTFTFTTYGYGHGVGMSQNGANALATYLGYDYKQILTYYYSGTEVY